MCATKVPTSFSPPNSKPAPPNLVFQLTQHIPMKGCVACNPILGIRNYGQPSPKARKICSPFENSGAEFEYLEFSFDQKHKRHREEYNAFIGRMLMEDIVREMEVQKQ